MGVFSVARRYWITTIAGTLGALVYLALPGCSGSTGAPTEVPTEAPVVADSGAASPAADASTGVSTDSETNVSPTINRYYKSPDLNVEMWAERFTGESREVFAERFNVLNALGLQPGQRVADIGAGTGLYIQLFAETVGPQGRVYAVDIAPPFLEFIARNAAADGLENVATVLGTDRSSGLPDGGVDVVFHSDTYHHFEYPQTMVRDLARALVPGGEMFVLDFERIEGVTPPRMLEHVRADKATVIEEIEASGFDMIEELDLPGLRENYLLRFRKR